MHKFDVYISSRTKEGGIYRYRMEQDRLTFLDKTHAAYPSYLAVEDKKMYVLLNTSIDGNSHDHVTYFLIDDNGGLHNQIEMICTRGQSSCHLCVEQGVAYVTNYMTGSVFKTPDVLHLHYGKGQNPQRQEAPHPHCVILTPDRKYLLVADLGLDSVFTYTKDFKLVSFSKVPLGHGARHLAFSADGKTVFCVNELASTVTMFFYCEGVLIPKQTISTLPHGYTGESYSSAIRVVDHRVYVSNRGHNSIAVFTFDSTRLHASAIFDCKGNFPRDFHICDDYLFCANQYSDTVTVFKIVGDDLQDMNLLLNIEKPMCVLFQTIV
jgi:6-phosphogluconolactonase